MLKRILCNIGYDNMRFGIYKDEIRARNVKKLHTFIACGLLLSLLDSAVKFARYGANFCFDKIIYLILYFFVLHIFFLFCYRPHRHVTLLLYSVEIPLMALAVYMGAFQNSRNPSIAIMVCLCAMPLFILDKP